jgi:hypothetical protein
VSGLANGQSLTVLLNGAAQTITAASGSPVSLGSVTADAPDYAVSIQSGAWHATSLTAGVYCQVQNGTGTATANVTDIAIVCGAPPSQIDLVGQQNGIQYTGWSLQYPVVVNGQLYYQGMQGGGFLITDMNTLQTLFNGSITPAMSAAGDPVNAGANNSTTLNTSTGSVVVAIPTIQQLENISCAANGQAVGCGVTGNPTMPSGWINALWSSTAAGVGNHTYLDIGYPLAVPDFLNFPVAFQVQ